MQSSNFQSQSYRQRQITRDLNGIRNSGGIVNGGLVTFLTLMALTYSVSAGEFNEVLSLGDQAPIWSNLPGTDGKQHSMSDDHDKTAIVLVFTSATCPTAIEYESRINEMAERMAGPGRQIALVAVCVNRVNGDQLSDLTERVKSKNLNFVYLYDETQKIAKDYGAIFTRSSTSSTVIEKLPTWERSTITPIQKKSVVDMSKRPSFPCSREKYRRSKRPLVAAAACDTFASENEAREGVFFVIKPALK